MVVVELLRLGADRIHNCPNDAGKARRILAETIISICSCYPPLLQWIWISGADPPPHIIGNLSTCAHAERQNFLLEERPEIELLRVAEIRKTKKEAISNEVAGQITFQDSGLVEGAVVGLADAVNSIVAG